MIPDPRRLLVQTEAGSVEGTTAPSAGGEICVWRGIPYAEAERFGAPRPPAGWTGPRPALAFGPACPQSLPPILNAFAGSRFDESCLVLNVFSRSPSGSPRPVMVWIHGGAFIFGSADLYDAAHLVASDEIVVVTLNYRLGALGFLDVGAALGRDDMPSNLGLRDQIAALRWIRDNIAGFGGDPKRITIAGESAGSILVSLLMLSDQASGLFHGAIMQSGAINLAHDADEAARIGKRILAILGLSGSSLEALRQLPVETVLRAQRLLHKEMPAGIPTIPWFDGDLLPSSLAAARHRPTPRIPLLAGSNRDEIRSFEMVPGSLMQSDRPTLEALLRHSLGEAASQQILAAYPDSRAGNRQLATDLYFGMPTLHFAERHATGSNSWFYRFDIDHPVLGAAHGLELLYLFDLQGVLPALFRGGPLQGARAQLAQRIRQHWTSFVRHGHPGADWPAFSTPRRATLLLDRVDRLVDDPDGPRRLVWAGRDVGSAQLNAAEGGTADR